MILKMKGESIMPTATRETFAAQVGLRVKAAREAKNLTQEELGHALSFKDRQTVAAIESGIRKVSAEELMRFMSVLDQNLDFFTDPFRLVGEGRFSFRARSPEEGGLKIFEEQAGCWIAFWREQGRRQGIPVDPIRPKLELNENSTFEDAQSAGEALWAKWKLGEVPSKRLAVTVEKELSILVLQVDTPKGVSGAACQVPGADSILINRHDLEGRRHFDLAHELFHVLTWDTLPPNRVDRENPTSYKDKHTERLADYFAAALLMPRAVIEALWTIKEKQGMELNSWLAATAAKLLVSEIALHIRLSVLGFIKEKVTVKEDANQKVIESGTIPPPFSRSFMERAGWAVERGDVSAKRLASILGLQGLGDMKKLFSVHGIKVPFDM